MSPDTVISGEASGQLLQLVAKGKHLSHILECIHPVIGVPQKDDAEITAVRGKFLMLISIARHPSSIAVVEDAYSTLPIENELRWWALRALAAIGTPEAVRGFLTHWRKEEQLSAPSADFVLVPLGERPLQPLLKAVLAEATSREWKRAALNSALYAIDGGRFKAEFLEPHRDMLLASVAEPFAVPTLDGTSKCDGLHALLADALGRVGRSPQSIDALWKLAHDAEDPAARAWALISLTRVGESVSPGLVGALTHDIPIRTVLFRQFAQLNHLDLIPEEHRTQQSAAECNMVQWLLFPTELGRPPGALELLERRFIRGSGWHFLFKFTDPAEPNDWLVGITGPQPTDGDSISLDGGFTFSHFNNLDSMSIEEHWDSLLQNV